ncbi:MULTISPECIES: bifunctional glutamate--cysteine ligase GshA/glutathione synthetase GshB [unclassified Streptococcus]|uniref:bifunctional glutamate--cysteine ligase GshA/glutathione synthetase GshB n=1 Tax=unclassified Streptococcus TaxID=2608887 RepID=UPI00107296C7|nr:MULTISPECIES: bifunctional glutamate--cysteine ligase GshA/glutathione synthetase GshB [unclassified Streptococcus]MBF0788263.1 bifunctional glutamate--cysteine ligase GshA/glutathione synthetase GshB [Streptococcus sp. 19428wC2_LYSM12]MCQ9211795.1 bifunctional glutamate--cysteine ligase GshA/glutathione synthetase GshB [Streptococcus sp. B01]MCQ9212915.1 bifunctional glutamate--cysteine ligase GshA/glutathione synthetase GshB [Streptococcus sp. O1]TFV04658.1 bifunctional glutamate--cysteine
MNINHLVQRAPKTFPILQATFGLERESLRMNTKHRIAQTPHPEKLGARKFHPYIQTDYSESQLELITPISPSTSEARRVLGAITDVAYRSMNKDEYLWPLSMPPYASEDEVRIAQLDNVYEYQYRESLGKRYGKLLQAMSGIHYNMEFGSDFVTQLFETSNYHSQLEFTNDLYLTLAQQFLRYRWFLTYLYGASPIAEKEELKKELNHPVRSLRNSSYGYVNTDDIHVSFADLESYVRDIEHCVATGQLSAEKEFYSAVRLRGHKHNRDYLTKGIRYLEFRCFDLNPFDFLAISQETLDTVHLFILALLWIDSPEDIDKTLKASAELNNQIALAHPLTPLPPEANTQVILEAMSAVASHFQLGEKYQKLVEKVKQQVAQPALTLSGQLVTHLKHHSLQEFARKQGQSFHEHAWTAPYALKGYEHMELSTQMLMFDAIQKGINLEILDEDDQFLKLWHKNHVEYVKNGNMTSKDNYVVPLAMANKTVTKKILAAAGFPVPAGAEFSTKAEALRYYGQVEKQAIVVKPKSTNFGLGISIFQEGTNLEDYEKALDIAFLEDKQVLVEQFIAGTEYRFFVLNGKCEAVLLRVAANVVGDGIHTIRELVQLKNQDPLRGRDHRSPLEVINLGDIERLMLSQQGYSPETILEAGQRAELRGNSNISTGGDSIDVTHQMNDSYKQLAAEMATAMGAWVCGVDLIIPNPALTSTKDQPNCTCIELNFNPSMYMHTYCYQGPGQALTPKIIAQLFPELSDKYE